MSLTEMQFALMNRIAHCEMNAINGATPKNAKEVNTYLWASEWAGDLGHSAQALGGCLTTLKTAGYVCIFLPTRGEPDGGVWFTDEGYAVWRAEFDKRGMQEVA